MLADFAVPQALAPMRSEPILEGRARRAEWTPLELERVAARLAARGGDALASVPLERRIAAWLDVVDALLDPERPERRALVPALVATSRLSPEGLSEALEVVVGGAGREALDALVARLPPPAPRGLGAVVLAANVPALAVQTLLPALLLGRPLLLKSSAREPLAAPALVAALVAREPALGEAFAAVTWPSGDEALESSALARAERIVAYGGAEALADLAARWGDRLVAHGPRASVALVAGAFDALRVARAIARDIALLDQRGCLSVQAVYVAGDARPLAEMLAFALEVEHARLPPGPIEPELAAAVQQLRGEADLAGNLVGQLELAAGSVIWDEVARFRPVPGLRTVRVHPVDSIETALAALAPWRGSLQGMAVAGDATTDLAATLVERLGVARVAAAGRLQHAEAGWASGGIDPLEALG